MRQGWREYNAREATHNARECELDEWPDVVMKDFVLCRVLVITRGEAWSR